MKNNRFDMVRNIRLELSGIKAPKKLEIEPNPCWEGYEPIGLKPDGSPNCVPLKEEQSKVVKEGFPIPSPEGAEDEQTFISRCMSELNAEFPDEAQKLAVCYKAWRGE
jgi:hypothetical protein